MGGKVKSSAQRVADILNLKVPLPKIQACSRRVRVLLLGLLSLYPHERIEASAAIQSPVFDLERSSPSEKAGTNEVHTHFPSQMRRELTVDCWQAKGKVTGQVSEDIERQPADRLRVSIRTERFHLREAKDVMTTASGAPPNETIYFLRLAESHNT